MPNLCMPDLHRHKSQDPRCGAISGEKANILARAELIKQKSNVCNDAIHEIEEKEAKLETNIASAKREVSQAADQTAMRRV